MKKWPHEWTDGAKQLERKASEVLVLGASSRFKGGVED